MKEGRLPSQAGVGHHTNLLLNGNDKQELERSVFLLHSTKFSFLLCCVMGEPAALFVVTAKVAGGLSLSMPLVL